METNVQKNNTIRGEQLEKLTMNQELLSAIKKALPSHECSSNTVKYKHYFDEHRSFGGTKDVSCCVVCEIEGERFYDRSYEPTKKKAWKRCIEFIVEKLTNQRFKNLLPSNAPSFPAFAMRNSKALGSPPKRPRKKISKKTRSRTSSFPRLDNEMEVPRRDQRFNHDPFGRGSDADESRRESDEILDFSFDDLLRFERTRAFYLEGYLQ